FAAFLFSILRSCLKQCTQTEAGAGVNRSIAPRWLVSAGAVFYGIFRAGLMPYSADVITGAHDLCSS
ncbi:hypothetical protein ABTF01_21155, partial [Acinetobacter baumannii]